MIEWLTLNWHYVAMACEFVITLILLIWKYCKSKSSDEKLKLKQAVLSTIASFCVEAEQMFGKGNGVKKKQWAMQQAKLKCVELGVEIPDETLEASIEEVVSATNSVNTYKGV